MDFSVAETDCFPEIATVKIAWYENNNYLPPYHCLYEKTTLLDSYIAGSGGTVEWEDETLSGNTIRRLESST